MRELTFAGGRAALLAAPGRDVPAHPFESRVHLSESVFKVVLQKSISTQIRQLILHINDKLTNL